MPTLVLDNSIGTFTSNSYADAIYADGYWAQHYSTVKAAQWAALSGLQKDSLLIQACNIIETARFTIPIRLLDSWRPMYDRHSRLVIQVSSDLPPIKFSYFQKLQFPRNLDRDPTSGALYIPPQVAEAQCEQAVYLLNFDETAMATRLQGIETDSVKVGDIQLSQKYLQTGSVYSPVALEFLRPFMIKTGQVLRRG